VSEVVALCRTLGKWLLKPAIAVALSACAGCCNIASDADHDRLLTPDQLRFWFPDKAPAAPSHFMDPSTVSSLPGAHGP
jgi:hypothetical protein